MGELAHHDPQELQLRILGDREAEEEISSLPTSIITNNQATIIPKPKKFRWWIKVALYSLFVLSGQSVAILLGRQYYSKGAVGFPFLFLLYFIPTQKHRNNPSIQTHPQDQSQSQSQSPSLKSLALVYLSVGTILAIDCYLYSVGLLYLPVSTYSLLCSSQLAFNALFSFFLNGPKRVIRKETFRTVLDMLVYQSIVAGVIILVGLFASREWEHLRGEMDGYQLGKASYVMNLVGTAIAWQVFGIGAIGLILDVSSAFSNLISAAGLPIVPIFAVLFFGDRMDGIKVISMILAIWGFVSYVYQNYLDDAKLKAQRSSAGGDEVR
ncbi:hypothetical protein BT93_L1331 [Corymbia citriodora subsp. variegata]|uniref:Probable purine permease n=1 Tax=Corymbia citriodora subsp. variegata TaxID=360336 RepID=A0A8T0CQF5_CORYI|nr:hypothetical protein BT93_L1331 [Corymbia citriodora subsp. variegata]